MPANMARCGRALLLPCVLGFVAPSVGAAVILPDEIGFSTPSGSQDTSSPFTDDVLLDSLTFGDAFYDGTTGSFSVASRFEVLTGRDQINAEWGDNDDGSDGNPDPFTKAGFAGEDQETTDPKIQDAALLNAFNSRSLSEITDGEGKADSSFQILFEHSLAFDDVGGDSLPDLVFFERGLNDTFVVELIIGGSFEDPIFSTGLSIDSGDFKKTGFKIDTVEISNSQDMGVGGLDLSSFGLSAGDAAFGFRLSSAQGQGPDLGGFFLAAENPDMFGASLNSVPLPATVWMLLSGLGLVFGFSAARRRRDIG